MNKLIEQWSVATGNPSPKLIRFSPNAGLALALRGDLANITVPTECAPVLPEDCRIDGESMGVIVKDGSLRVCVIGV